MHYAPTSTTANQPAIRQQFPRLTRPWFEGGDKGAGKGKDWAERALGWTARIVQHPPKPRHVRVPAGAAIDWAAILPPPGFRGALPRRWVGKRIFAWLGQNRRLSKDFERPCATGEALVYAAMARLMLRDLARA